MIFMANQAYLRAMKAMALVWANRYIFGQAFCMYNERL
jgi:hypothetical protein